MESDGYLLVLVRQGEVGLDVRLHPPEQVRIDGVPQHAGTLVGRLHLRIKRRLTLLAGTERLCKTLGPVV